MTENPNQKEAEEYQFIKEEIVPKKKSRWLRRLGTLGFVVCMAVVFGLVAQAVFLVSGEYMKEWLGIEEERPPITFTRPTFYPTKAPLPTKAPTKTPLPTPTTVTKAPSVTAELTPELTRTVTGEPVITSKEEENTAPSAVPTVSGEQETQGEGNGLASENGQQSLETAASYMQIYQEISQLAEDASEFLVTVEAVEQGVDWFQETYEKRTRTTGLILYNDGFDLLILVGTEQISGASSILVYFGKEMAEGRIYSLDKEYGLAVVAVPLNQISEEAFSKVRLAVLAEEKELHRGMPVIALGAPNGYEDSMEFGMVTSAGRTVSVSDGEVSCFTTNIMEYKNSYGFVVGLDGKVLGMITHIHKENPEDGIFTAIFLDSMRGVIEGLLNNSERAYFGIKGLDLPENLRTEYRLEQGVYVREVENASPALTAGIKAGDIIVSVGDKPVAGISEFTEVLLKCSTREIVPVHLYRRAEDGMKELTLEVALTGKNQAER